MDRECEVRRSSVLLTPENCPNGWDIPPGDSFMVRGPEYLTNKVKVPGGEYLLKPLGFDWIKGAAKICEILNDEKHRVRKAIDEEVSHGNQPFVWAFNLQCHNYCDVPSLKRTVSPN
jgi:hypothetical protein